MGGPSSEHEVSLASGKMVLQAMPASYDVLPVVLPRHRNFVLMKILPQDIDAAFLALHGEYGEDGQVQKELEKLKIPYTGSDSKTSAFTINKYKTASLLRQNGLTVPEHRLLKKNESFPHQLSWPCVVKPNSRGSSVGVSIVQKPSGLKSALKLAFRFDQEVLIEKFISGKELTCGVVNISPTRTLALVPTEIIPKKASFFDYQSKYTRGASLEITPPQVSKNLIKRIQNSALRVHKIVGAYGMSRTDMILGQDRRLYVLEINTIPGMTKTSLLPQGAAASGIDFPTLLDLNIKNALQRKVNPVRTGAS